MKKILSVFLAALMLFSVLGVSASAAGYLEPGFDVYFNQNLADKDTQVVFCFDTNSGTMMNGVYVYDVTNNTFVYTQDFSGRYIMLPRSKDTQLVGQHITLPIVAPQTGYMFRGWYCYLDGNEYAGGSSYQIPAGTAGQVIEFRATYTPAPVEDEGPGAVIDILVKVFGAIAGILLYNGDTAQGIALFEKILGALDL